MSDLEAGVTYYVRARAYVYDETKGDYVYGTPSKVLTIVKRKVSSISGLKLAEKTQSSYVLSYTGTIMDDEEIQYQISESSAFVSNPEKTKTYVVSGNNDSCFNISYSNLTPGKKYYVRARVHNTNDENEDINKAEREYYGPFTNVVSFSTAIPKINVFSSVVTSTSITLNMDTVNNDKFLTGYQIQRKSGKKYVTIAKTTDNSYKDSKLTKDTAYTYKIRPYYVNPKTNKTTWGSWVYYNTTTWGGNLNLKASPASTTSVKLTWNKISGAKGYEVYRAVTNSGSDKYSSSTGYNSYTKWTLVKTINKSTTKTTTVKGLVSGMSYSFKVRAFKTVGSKKYYIEGVAAADLGFGEAVRILSTKQSTNGKVKVTWAPVRSGNGYLIEKLDDVTGKWKTYKKFTKASTSSYTFPKATGKPVNYRIRAFKKGSVVEYSSATSITVDPFLAAPTGVSVKANNTDGSIKVSWKAVSGADYYVVYRTTSSSSVYDSDTKSYRYTTYSDTVPVYVADATQKSGYKYQYEPLTATSIVDRPVSYTTNGVEQVQYEGPTPGVKYYYYVKAFKYGTAYNYNDRYETTYPSGGSKAAGTTVSLVTVKKPTLKSVKSTAKGKVTVQWSKVSDAKGYVVYRSTKKSSGYTQIATISSAKTVKYTDKTAKSGKKYYYKVRAVKANEAGIDKFSSYSNIKYVSKVK